MEEGRIRAKIDEKNGTLTFMEDSTSDLQESIDCQLKSLMNITPNMERLNRMKEKVIAEHTN